MYIIVGLGNPGEEYVNTRHNIGRMAEEYISQSRNLEAKFVWSDNFMNKSGSAVAKFVKSKKATKNLIVIHDDMDLPLGTIKVSYNRSSGGHKGVESIIRAIKTEGFVRVRIGISPTTPSGKIKKPKGEKEVEKFILGKFKKPEMEILKTVLKNVSAAVFTITEHSLGTAMTKFN